MGGMLSPPFPVVHDQLLCLADVEGEVVARSLTSSLVVGDRAKQRCVVSKLNDGVVVVGEQGVQEGTKHAPLRGTRVENQRGIRYHLGAACQEVQDLVAEGGVPGSLA